MKKTNTSIDKMTKNIDKELKNLLLTDLKVIRMADNSLVKNINNQLMIA